MLCITFVVISFFGGKAVLCISIFSTQQHIHVYVHIVMYWHIRYCMNKLYRFGPAAGSHKWRSVVP